MLQHFYEFFNGWIIVHAMIDGEVTSILGLEVTDESVQDDQIIEPLINKTTKLGG